MKINFIAGLIVLFQVLLVASTNTSPSTTFSPFDSPEFCSQIITPTCNTTFSYIDDLNKQIRPYFSRLIKTPYFKYFKIDLDKQCKFWDAQHFCATENCAVEILPPSQYNWSDVENDNLKPSKLGKINRPDPTSVVDSIETEVETCEDIDYTHIDDDHHCVYVNLLDNPERFTGYGGNQSFDVWKAIYSENCFPNTNPMSMTSEGEPEHCIEKHLFYRVVSGMHASIAVHLSNEYLCPSTGEFYPNLKVFMERVGAFNDRLSNIYFNYALVSQAIVKLSEILPIMDYINEESSTSTAKQQLLANNRPHDYEELLNSILPSLSSNVLFNTSSLFNPNSAPANLKDEFRSRFKNVSAIMDCVGCDRCRMWGKLQTIGYGTALKILFESEDPKNSSKLKFRRIELVALFNTFDRLSKSIEAINNFKLMYLKHLDDVKKGLAKPGEYEKTYDHEGFDFPFFSTPSSQETGIKRKLPPQNPSSSASSIKKIRSPLEDQKRESTFMDEFKFTINEVYEATLFVLKCYKEFPTTVYKFGLVQLSSWWDSFVGRDKLYRYYDEFSVYDNQEKSEYIQLFND